MSDELVTPVDAQKRDNSTLLIIILAVILIFFCCCCLMVLLVGWFVGDYIVDWFRIVSFGIKGLYI